VAPATFALENDGLRLIAPSFFLVWTPATGSHAKASRRKRMRLMRTRLSRDPADKVKQRFT